MTRLILALAAAALLVAGCGGSGDDNTDSQSGGGPVQITMWHGQNDIPEKVRVQVVEELPAPQDPVLVAAAGRIGLMPQAASGMTLGYAVLLKRGAEKDTRLLSHELRHVAQYEEKGGIRPFLAVHIPQLMQFGYEDSPFERDARAHETRGD